MSFNLTVGETTVKTLEEYLTTVFSEIEIVKELMNSSPTFTEFIQVVPTILVNLVLFSSIQFNAVGLTLSTSPQFSSLQSLSRI